MTIHMESYDFIKSICKVVPGCRVHRAACNGRQQQGKDAFLRGATRKGKEDDEDALLTFAVFLARVMKRTDGTVKQRLFATWWWGSRTRCTTARGCGPPWGG